MNEQQQRSECGSVGPERWQGKSQDVIGQAPERNRPSRRTKAVGYIYFIETADGRFIKIGFTGNPRQRYHQLVRGNPNPLRFLGYMPGTLWEEQQIHSRFAGLRHYGEWFINSVAIQSFIHSLKLTPVNITRRREFKHYACDFSNVIVIPVERQQPKAPVLTLIPSVPPRPRRVMDPSEMGRIGGRARSLSLTPGRRTEIAREAARARWGKAKRQ